MTHNRVRNMFRNGPFNDFIKCVNIYENIITCVEE